MKQIISLLIISMLIISCNNNDEDNHLQQTNISTSIHISYFNKNNIDLLNPSQDSSYKKEGIYLYYMKNGTLEKVFSNTENASKGFKILKRDNDSIYRISIFGISDKTKTRDTLLIQLTKEDTDTLMYETKHWNNSDSKQITKVWYNDIIKWEMPNKKERYFQILK